MREVPGFGSFQALSDGALDGQEQFALAHKLPLRGLRRRHMSFNVSSTQLHPKGNGFRGDGSHRYAVRDFQGGLFPS